MTASEIVDESAESAEIPTEIIEVVKEEPEVYDPFAEALAKAGLEDHQTIKSSIPQYTPDSELIYELKDSVLLVQKFTIPSWEDPREILREPFEYLGYRYEFQGISKNQLINTEVAEFEEKITVDLRVSTKDAAYAALMPMLEPTIEFEDEEGLYKGELTLDPDSIVFTTLNSRTSTATKTTTRTYTSSFNDDSIIPQIITADGYTWTLQSRSWSSGSFMTDASVPSSYTATAVYSRQYSYGVNDGYQATVTYRSELSREEDGDICYEVTYLGTPLNSVIEEEQSPCSEIEIAEDIGFKTSIFTAVKEFFSKITEFFKFLTGTNDGTLESRLGTTVSKLGYFLVSVALTIVVIMFLWKFIKAILKNRAQSAGKAIISARDDFSGVESRIQKVSISKKRPVITINYAKAPQAKHFTITLKPEVAGIFTGHRITINIGKEVRTHLVGQSHNNDYVIPVDWNG